MRARIKDYFHFNKSERRGTLSLFIIIICLLIGKELLVYFNPEAPSIGIDLDSLKVSIEKEEQALLEHSNRVVKDDSTLFYEFDPNGLSIKEWMKFGLSEKQANSIKNYENKGGSFRTKSDVEKMYTISEEMYSKMEPFILLPDSIVWQGENNGVGEPKWKKTQWKNEKRIYPKVLVNTADTAELKKLYGIGNYYALKIVDYREQLGGFVSKKQLNEIWGLKREVIQRLDTQLIVNSIPIRKLNINRATVEELKQHPYIFWKVANSIVKYREQHGSYTNVEEIKQSELISDSLFQKLLPYLEK